MDLKKKIDEAYIPDQQARKERVVVGLSGGLDSYVTAYLLKIQKYDLIGVTIANHWDELSTTQSSGFLSCHLNQEKLDAIKEFCHKLGISHQIIKTSDEFKDAVVDPWVEERLMGKLPLPCWNCHELRMRTLHQKMLDVGAKFMATGHYAKIFHQDGQYNFIHTSNEEEHDQSALLSRLPQNILSGLILPLSDLSRKEVIKLGQNFGVNLEEKPLKMHQCLTWSAELNTVFEKVIPSYFKKEGDMLDEDNHQLGPHQGVYQHTSNEMLFNRDSGKTLKEFFFSYREKDKRMLFMKEDFFLRDSLFLTDCHFSEGTSWPVPVKGYLVIHDQFIECMIHIKTLSSAYLELVEKLHFKQGEILSVVKKKGKNSKVYFTGRIRLLPREPIPEGDSSDPQVDRSRDF